MQHALATADSGLTVDAQDGGPPDTLQLAVGISDSGPLRNAMKQLAEHAGLCGDPAILVVTLQ